jgi:aspartate aminotransferase
MEGLSGIEGVKTLEPEGAFYVLVDVSGVIARKKLKDDKDFVQRLLEQQQVVTVAGSAFGAPNTFRISFAMSEEEIKKGLERIKTFCAS